MRKLVTIRSINELRPIEGADAIECAVIDGWTVVVKKGEFRAGDPCVYFEIDSFLPESDPRYTFLMKNGVREFEGVRGHRLRTVKLRGQLSQGLALPLHQFPELLAPVAVDLADLLRIKKWEMEIPAALAGQVEGAFPSFIEKTDQERCQNLINEIFVDNANARFEVTTKLDGTSCTIFARRGDEGPESGVCSRNLQLKVNEANANNTLVSIALKSGLLGALQDMARDGEGSFAVQGELMGPGIQGNREQLKVHQLFIFDVQVLHEGGSYLTPNARSDFMQKLYDWGVKPDLVKHAPVLFENVSLTELNIHDVGGLLKFAEGPSLNHAVREGVVFKRTDGKFSFKAISNAFLLLKEKE